MSSPHEVLRGPVDTPTEGEGGLYAAPNSTFDTPPPYDWGYRPGGAHAHGGPVKMALGGTTPVSTGGQYQPRESEGPGFFRNNDNYENSSAGGINFIKNLVQDLSPAQREAQRLVSEATRKSGKEALVFGRGENPADLAKLTQGTYENVSIPSNYAQYALQSADPFFTFHTHGTNTLSPSAADLRIWGATQPGTIGLPYQSMFINASPQDSLLRIGVPGKWMDSDAQRLVQEVLNLKNKNEDLVANHGFMDPRMREFWKGNKLPDLAHLLHAESDQMPGVKSYLDKREPGAAQGVTMRDLYAGNFLQRIAERGIPVDVSAEHKIAGTPYLARDVWPEFAAHVQKYALPKAEGGPVEMSGGGADKIKDAVGFFRRLANYSDPSTKHIDDYKWKPMSEVGERLGHIERIPPHVENFGAFMQEQAQRAANEGHTPRDLLKAFGISRGSIQRSALPTDSIRATGLDIPGTDPMIRPEGAFATWMGTPAGQSWLNNGERGIVDFDAINDAKQRLAPFGKSNDLAQFLQWGPENLPGREGRISELVDRARKPGNSSPEEWKDAVGDLFGIKLAKRGFFSAMLGRGDQPVFDARQIDLNVPKGNYSDKYEKRAGTEGGDEIMARLAARQNALGIGVPKDLLPFQQYLTHHTTWDKLGNEATTHQDLIDSLRGHADGGPVEMQVGGADKIKDAVGFLRRSIMPHAREKSMVPPNRDIESRYWDHKKPSDLDTITADYGVNHLPVDVPTMKIEDIKGGRVFSIPHDRSATDLLLGGYNGNTFANPVTSPGGPLYAFGRNPEAVTASGEKVIKNLHESALRAADEGKTPYLAPWLMGPHGVDFSTHMNEAVVQSLPFLKVPTEKKKEVDALLSGVFKDFPGIDHKDLAQYLNSITGTTRRDLPKLLDTGAMVNAGLDVGGLRAALTEPSLLHAPYGSSGAAISRIDPSMSPTMFGYPHHPSYPWQLRGTPVGGLDPLVPSQILYPDIYRTLPPDTQLGPKGRPVNNRRAFEMKSMLGDVYQDVNDEVINGVNEYQEYMRKLRGWKEGGTVEDEYHPIWQQSFAGGGQPDRPRLDGFDAMARNRPDEYNPVSASLYPWLMDKEDFGPDYGFRKINGPLDLTHNMDNSLLFQSREPFEGRGFTLTPEEKRARWLEKRGLEDKPESTLNPYDLIKMYADDLGRRHKEWKPSYSGESLPRQMLQSAGDLGRVVSKSITGGLGDTLSASMRPWDGSYEDRLMQENDLTRQSERDIHPFLKDISSIPAMISQRLWAGPAIGDAVTNLATPADSVGEWAGNQIRPIVGALRNVPDAASKVRDMFSGVRPTGGEDPGYFDHGGPVGYAGGGHAKDTGNTFDFLGPFGAGLNLIADGAGAIFNGEDFELDKALGYLGEIGGGLVAPGVGGPLGRGAGTMAAHLIEPGEGDVGRDALNAGYGALRGGMGMFFARGGSTGFGPQGDEEDPNDLTRFLSPQVNPSKQPGPMDWAGAGGIPGAISPPLNANNGQVARDAAERQRLMQMAEGASRQALQGQGSKGGGGGGGMGDLTQIASMAMKFLPMMMAAEGGPVPNQDGEQPWMYGDGALMARGGYLRGCGGMNG